MSAYTKEEVQENFINHLCDMANYWSTQDCSKKDAVEGMLFSMFALLDGNSVGFPAMNVSVDPHPDDQEYLTSIGEKYYEPDMVFNDDVWLHEMYATREIP